MTTTATTCDEVAGLQPPTDASTELTHGVPYEKDPCLDHASAAIQRRQEYVEHVSGVHLDHVRHFSFDPALTRGNIESLTGVAQVPLGIAGPLRVNGEYARGDFLIPLATTEGSLVASYNRGMKVLNASGGVTATVVEDHMQRAPVFVFASAREARTFRDWLQQRIADIRGVAESTSHVAKLQGIETYLSNNLAFLRFDFATGDAAGQ